MIALSLDGGVAWEAEPLINYWGAGNQRMLFHDGLLYMADVRGIRVHDPADQGRLVGNLDDTNAPDDRPGVAAPRGIAVGGPHGRTKVYVLLNGGVLAFDVRKTR